MNSYYMAKSVNHRFFESSFFGVIKWISLQWPKFEAIGSAVANPRMKTTAW